MATTADYQPQEPDDRGDRGIGCSAVAAGLHLLNETKTEGQRGSARCAPGPTPVELETMKEAESQKRIEEEIHAKEALAPVTTNKSELLLVKLRETIKADSTSTINVLRTWMTEPKGSDDPA